MKFTVAILMVIALGAGAAAAKPSPYAPPLPAQSDDALYRGPAGTMLEADYFRAPPPPQFGARRVFPCQLHLQIERASRLLQSCD